MKTVIYIIGLFFCLSVKCQQQPIDTIYLKGYRVIQYKKSEIEFSLKNEKLRKAGKSYEKMIDFENKDFFILLNNFKRLNELIKNRNPFNQSEVYYLPNNNDVESYIKKICNVTIDLSEQKNLFINNCKYWYADKQDEYLYKFYLIEGYSLKATIENNESNRFKLDLSFGEIDKNMKTFMVYFLFNIKKIDCNQDSINGFKIWKYKDPR